MMMLVAMTKSESAKSRLVLISASVGIFFIVTGGRILLPWESEWLMWGDGALYQLGWESFRQGPLLTWPLGNSPNFGAGYASTVVYADAIPLIAIPMKFLLAPLTSSFQYYGLWILSCFIGQALSAHSLLRRLQVQRHIAVSFAVAMCLSPALLYRLVTGGYGHMALFAQFLLLLAIRYSLEDSFPRRKWAVLCTISLLIQFYLFVAVALIAVCVLIRDFHSAKLMSLRQRSRVLLTCLLVMAVPVLVAAVTVGYFVAVEPSDEGFGIFRADLLTLIDPNTVDFSWSRTLPDFHLIDGSHEGFAYLGLGLLVICPCAILALRDSRVQALKPASIAGLLGFILALSNRIQIAGREFAVYPLPSWLTYATGIVRSSGRFVWIAMYLCFVFVALGLSQIANSRRQLAAVLLAGCLTVQFTDLRHALPEVRERFTDNGRPPRTLLSPAWDEMVSGKNCLLTSPPQFKGPLWIDFAELAIRHHMSTNAAYLTRLNSQDFNRHSSLVAQQINGLQLDRECLYVVVTPNPDAEIRQLENLVQQLKLPIEAKVLDGYVALRTN
ncbi:MAG: hypothetical protein EB104_02045 [Acidimicrobiia bacterium]|nr:hypothetical protein [Acidimicrobiia bacterium]